jgi:choline dehydrogenase
MITSNNPLDKPRIETDFLSTEHDRQDIMDGSRMVRSIAATSPLSDIVESEHLPGIQAQSEADIFADFAKRAGSVYHASCTCAMGTDPATSVVDAIPMRPPSWWLKKGLTCSYKTTHEVGPFNF